MVPDTDCSVLRHLKGSEVLLRLLCSCIVWDFKSTAQTEQCSYTVNLGIDSRVKSIKMNAGKPEILPLLIPVNVVVFVYIKIINSPDGERNCSMMV